MRQRFHPYPLWEDWAAGMYRHEPTNHDRVASAGSLLASTTSFLDTSTLVVVEWPYSTEHNLSDLSQNRRAWLGQASAAYRVGASQAETCIAWNTRMTEHERYAANHVADTVINSWYSSAFQLEMRYV